MPRHRHRKHNKEIFNNSYSRTFPYYFSYGEMPYYFSHGEMPYERIQLYVKEPYLYKKNRDEVFNNVSKYEEKEDDNNKKDKRLLLFITTLVILIIILKI
jgi:hypothetical protein